ncbi:MAG: histidine phosphatase family protein [Clostridia bacterium]|nr:histidine phosphatase family protein [Clostridia bacterium]
MVEIYFIRHGQTYLNVEGILAGTIDTELTEKGIQDTKEAFKDSNINFNYVYCSPLKRTWQTAKAIMGENVELKIDDRITEVYTGVWQGIHKNELPKEEYELYKSGLLNPPGGEKLEDVDKRILSFIEEIFSKYSKDEKILVVTHNALMRNLKRLFFKTKGSVEPKNLEIIKITKDDYDSFFRQ